MKEKHRYSASLGPMYNVDKSNIRLAQLSHDVLTYIFALVGPKNLILDTFMCAEAINEEETSSLDSCLAFSQVCRYWRRVALDTATLWSAPLFLNMALGALMLERAKKTPLTIFWPPFVDSPVPAGSSLLEVLQGNFEQITTLSLTAPAHEFDAMSGYFLSHATTLKKLRLIYSNSWDSEWPSARVLNYQQLGLLPGITSIMTHLHLNHCFILLPITTTRHLTTLNVWMSSLVETDSVSIDHLLDLLESVPALVDFQLYGILGAASNDVAARKVVDHLKLQNFAVNGDITQATQLLACMHASGVQLFDVVTTTSMWETYLASVPKSFIFLKSILQHSMARCQPYPSLTLELLERSMDILASRSFSSLNSDDELSQAVYKIETKRLNIKISVILNLVSCCGDLSHVRMLELRLFDMKLDHRIEEEDLPPHGFPHGDIIEDLVPDDTSSIELMKAVPQLEILILIGDTTALRFLSVLRPIPQYGEQVPLRDDDDGQAKGRSLAVIDTRDSYKPVELCPKLNVLYLYDTSLALGEGSTARGPSPEEPNKVAMFLEMFVRARQEWGLPMQQLQAVRAELQGDTDEEKDEWLEYFRQWVAKVELDVLPYGTRQKIGRHRWAGQADDEETESSDSQHSDDEGSTDDYRS
jgi:hypothetical protein